VVAGFTGFLLGYSVPPMVEIRSIDEVGEVTTETMDSEEDKEISDYYKELQDLQ
jgi:hypothetical protein